jgi:hypothetical protein
LSWDILVQWVGLVCVAGGLAYTVRRNNKADIRSDSELKTQIKTEVASIVKKLEDPKNGLTAIKEAVEHQAKRCGQISTSIAEQVKANRRDIDRLRNGENRGKRD